LSGKFCLEYSFDIFTSYSDASSPMLLNHAAPATGVAAVSAHPLIVVGITRLAAGRKETRKGVRGQSAKRFW